LKAELFTTKVLIAVVAIIISLILFIVGFALLVLYKLNFATLYLPFHDHGTFLLFLRQASHIFSAPFVDIFALRRTPHILKLFLKNIGII
jgi:hypothetical protein